MPPAQPAPVTPPPEWAVKAAQSILCDYHVKELDIGNPLRVEPGRDMRRFPEMPAERIAAIIQKHYENRDN